MQSNRKSTGSEGKLSQVWYRNDEKNIFFLPVQLFFSVRLYSSVLEQVSRRTQWQLQYIRMYDRESFFKFGHELKLD